MLKWFKNSGPGALVAAAFIGPGTVTVCTIAGVRFGYDLLWAMVLSIIATIVLQEMAARLGIITRKGLSDVIRQEIQNPFIKYIIVALILFAIVIGNAVYEAGNISGGRLGLETLFNNSNPDNLKFLSLIIGAFAFTLLYLGNYKILERALVSLVILMSIAFVVTAILTKPNLASIAQGMLVPSVNENNLLTIVGLIGTTVVPYNLFLHASLVKEKWKTQDDLHFAKKDTIVSVAFGGLVSMAIIISAASAGIATVTNVTDLAKGLEPLFGSFAKYFLSIGLFAAGITSAITAPLAAAYVTHGCLGWDGNMKSFKFRMVWMFVLFLGVLFSSLGINPIEIIKFAQVANGAVLPIIVGILLWIMNKESVLGRNRNTRFQNSIGIIIFILSIVLGLKSIIQVINRNMTYSIDINCDLGEGVGNDAQLMPYLSSCNIACGGHAGDDNTMRETIRLAIENNVKIGAHPSFPDRENFGRLEMNLPNNELTTVIIDQILRLKILTEEAGGKLNHVKPHGALYNMAAVNDSIAEAVLDAMTPFDKNLILYVPYGSVIARKAIEGKQPIKYEAFADRNYNEDLTLVSRKLDNAVLEDPDQIIDHVIRMIKEKKVKTINGNFSDIEAGTLCVHGDNPHAVAIVSQLSKNLKNNNVSIE